MEEVVTQEDLIKKIEDKENKLSSAIRESDCWNKGKYKKSSSNAPISKIYVDSLRREISSLREQLSEVGK